jgi:hypothetical protein
MKNIKTKDKVQELIDLTPKQKKAFAGLIRAVKRCYKENVFFYQVLERIGGLNGNNIDDIMTDVEYPDSDYFDPICLQGLEYPCINIVCSFADDNHFVKLKED